MRTMPLHIRTRNDLIKYVTDHAPWLAIQRALLNGKTENYGAFSSIYKSIDHPAGWVLRISSKTGKTWFLGVTPNNGAVTVILTVPWRYWIGIMNPDNNFHAGDNPEQYRKERDDDRNKSV